MPTPTMLKTLTREEPELIRLCRAKTWVAMARRCESHPEEAKPTSLAMHGAGTTALAIAVRSGAPIEAIQALVRANVQQLGIVHKFSGSILHEALKHRAPCNVLRYLLEAVIHYERVHHGHGKEHRSLLGRQDQQKRNVLHSMVVRAMRELEGGGDHDGMWILFRSVFLAYPQGAQVMDADGNTPLVLALLIPGFNDSVHSERDETYVFQIVQLMITTCPSAVTIARTVKHKQSESREDNEDPSSPITSGDGAPTPLTYALLYGRSESTIQLLLEAHRKLGVNPCLTLVSGYREVPLHLAVTLRSPVTLLRDLIEYDPNALRVQDMHNLTPLHWAWIRHVVDWCSTDTSASPPDVMPSMRRYLSSHFAGWHDRASDEMKAGDAHDKNEISDLLLDRMRLLLPAAARAATTKGPTHKQGETWSLLHSACAVSCPLAVVRLACQEDPDSLNVYDVHARRLPLHYAAARTGYRATVPVGVSREQRTLSEPSPAMEVAAMFVEATRVVDEDMQLPLHIAIDTAKREKEEEEEEIVMELLRLYADSLERRDGKTMLYPFLLAAEGPDASLNLTFVLLRKQPTLVYSGRQ